MKRSLPFILLFVFSVLLAEAQQWVGNNNASDPLWRAGAVGFGGVTNPTSTLDLDGIAKFRRPGSSSYGISIVEGAALSLVGWGSNNPYIEWRNSNSTRQGYLGWNTDRLSLVLENGFNYTVEGGNMGIGTANPRGRFDVDGTGDIYLADDVNTGSSQSIFLPGHVYLAPYLGGNISYLQARRFDNSGSTALRIRTYNNGVLTEAMHIEPSGILGLGITNPNAATKLHVYEPGSSTSVWRGRIVASGQTKSVVLGEYNGMALFGAHNSMLNSWTDLVMQIGGKTGIGHESPSQKLTVAGNILQESENSAFGVDAQSNARFGVIKQFGSYPAIASDVESPIIFAQTNQTGIFTNIAGATLTERMRVHTNGNVGIGTKSPDQKLTVKGKIHAEEVIIDLAVPAPDYVFEENYLLTPLDTLEAYIAHHKHLPEVPSAQEMEKDGVKVAEMEMVLLKKIEELTLHLIKVNKTVEELQAEISNLKKNTKH